MKKEDSGLSDHHNMDYLPFGAGKRNCIGKYFATYTMKNILYQFMKNFEIKGDDSVEFRLTKTILQGVEDGRIFFRPK